MKKTSPLAPASFPVLPALGGVRLGAVAAGIAYKGRTDLMAAHFEPDTSVAGVFTQSKTRSAPVEWCQKALGQGIAGALVVNAGNSNAFTGLAGREAVKKSAEAAAKVFGCEESAVFLASTGVIGERLDDDALCGALPGLADSLSPDGWEEAAHAIMTTDTYAKGATRTADIGGVTVTLNGIAKGSGMIAPDMATMLAFVFTDAHIPAAVLQNLLADGVDKSFNRITVDSDTSTSDTLLLFATGAAGNDAPSAASDPALAGFCNALDELLLDLAHQVVRDGEGASKFIAVTVTGAETDQAAKIIALSIANSPLVKTGVAGEDANWGRVVMAVGKAGQAADRDKMTVSIGGVVIAEKGEAVAAYDEAPVASHMKGQNITIETDVGVGNGRATVWTCDFTHDYISINADYRS